jgi:hypothetical protein
MTAATHPQNGRTLRSDLDALTARISKKISERPFAATATAAGVGFVLGGGMTRAATALLIQTGTRIGASWLSEVVRRMEAPETAQENRP